MENELIKELLKSGASSKEAEELSQLTKVFDGLKVERSYLLKRKFLEGEIREQKRFIPRWFLAPALAFALVILVGGLTAAKAQSSLPGDPLYPLKRATEEAISIIDPSFNNQILQRRSEEVEKVSQQESPKKLNKAVGEYKKALENENVSDKTIEESQKKLEKVEETVKEQDKEKIKNLIQESEKKQEEVKKKIEDQNKDNQIKDNEDLKIKNSTEF